MNFHYTQTRMIKPEKTYRMHRESLILSITTNKDIRSGRSILFNSLNLLKIKINKLNSIYFPTK